MASDWIQRRGALALAAWLALGAQAQPVQQPQLPPPDTAGWAADDRMAQIEAETALLRKQAELQQARQALRTLNVDSALPRVISVGPLAGSSKLYAQLRASDGQTDFYAEGDAIAGWRLVSVQIGEVRAVAAVAARRASRKPVPEPASVRLPFDFAQPQAVSRAALTPAMGGPLPAGMPMPAQPPLPQQ